MEKTKIISDLISEIKPVLLEVGIGTPSIAFKSKKIEELDEREFGNILKWFNLVKAAVVNYHDRKGLVPESRWREYENLCITGLTEQRLLKVAKDALIDIWRKRPEALKRTTNESSKGRTKKTHQSGKASGSKT